MEKKIQFHCRDNLISNAGSSAMCDTYMCPTLISLESGSDDQKLRQEKTIKYPEILHENLHARHIIRTCARHFVTQAVEKCYFHTKLSFVDPILRLFRKLASFPKTLKSPTKIPIGPTFTTIIKSQISFPKT